MNRLLVILYQGDVYKVSVCRNVIVRLTKHIDGIEPRDVSFFHLPTALQEDILDQITNENDS